MPRSELPGAQIASYLHRRPSDKSYDSLDTLSDDRADVILVNASNDRLFGEAGNDAP